MTPSSSHPPPTHWPVADEPGLIRHSRSRDGATVQAPHPFQASRSFMNEFLNYFIVYFLLCCCCCLCRVSDLAPDWIGLDWIEQSDGEGDSSDNLDREESSDDLDDKPHVNISSIHSFIHSRR